MFALLTAPWPIIPFHTLCLWYNNRKAVIIFPMPQALAPRWAFAQRLATALVGQLYHCAHCASWYNNDKVVIIEILNGLFYRAFSPKLCRMA